MKGRLAQSAEFADIIVGSKPDGSFIRVKDIGTVELGARTYSNVSTFNGKPAAAISVSLVPGANALETAALLKAKLDELAAAFPQDLDYSIVYDTSAFVEASVEAVIHTFIEALVLVLIVVFLFLQNWRTTLIPMLAVPVSLVATFAAFQLLGFTINTLSLFGMVLAIGIVVDDAIVVVEAVEHNMRTGLKVREATIKAMDEVQGPVIAIALILAAVFVPMGFIPGVTGQLYKQFAVTVAVSTGFSALVALTLTPTLCILLMKPHEESNGPVARFFKGFNSGLRLAERALRPSRPHARPPHAAGDADAGHRRAGDRGPVPRRADRLRAGRGQGRRLHAGAAARRGVAGAHRRRAGEARTAGPPDRGRRLRGRRHRLRPAVRHGRLERRAGHRQAEAVGRAHHAGDRRAVDPDAALRARAGHPRGGGDAVQSAGAARLRFGVGLLADAAGALEPAARGTGGGGAGLHRRGAEAARDRPHQHDLQRRPRRTTSCSSTARRRRSSACRSATCSRRCRRSSAATR